MNYLCLAIGVAIGTILTRVLMGWRTTNAVFRIDHSNPEKDIFRLELNDINIDKKKWLYLRIDHKADLSHE